MARRNISKIIESGSPKQRIKLLIEDLAIKRNNGKGLLSEEQAVILFDSFQSEEEVKTFKKWQKLDRKITNALITLNGLKFHVLTNYSNLRGYIFVWQKLEEAELLTNSILHEIPKEERKRILQQENLRNRMMFSKVEEDEEGYLNFRTEFTQDDLEIINKDGKPEFQSKGEKVNEYSLSFVMNNVKRQAEEAAIQYKSWKQAIEDFMKKEGFNIKFYKDLIDEYTGEVETPMTWDKYSPEEDSFTDFLGGYSRPSLDKLKPLYNITPEFEKLEVNQEIYNSYMKEYLRDE